MEYRLNVEISESEVTLFVCCSAKNFAVANLQILCTGCSGSPRSGLENEEH